MAGIYLGRIGWSVTTDEDGYRTYTLKSLVQVSSVVLGPANALFAAGAPAVGSIWSFGGDIDSYCWCRPNASAEPALPEEPYDLWYLTQYFSNKPLNSGKGCASDTINDPLSQPQKYGGSFVKYTQSLARDRFGNMVRTSAGQQITGPQTEWDDNRPTVWVEQNVASLGISTIYNMRNCVNDNTLWGLPKRCIKLANITFSRELYGTCGFYFTRRFEFDINPETFDREIPDYGELVLDGNWGTGTGSGSGTNPNTWYPSGKKNVVRFHDNRGNFLSTLLDGSGNPYGSGQFGSGTGFDINLGYGNKIQGYNEANFLTLGIPSSIG